MKKLLFLGGSIRHVPMIQELRKADIYVICLDVDPDAPGKDVANEFYPISITNLYAVQDKAIELGIDGCISVPDIGVRTCASVNSRLGLHGININTYTKASNKNVTNHMLSKAGIRVPEPTQDKFPLIAKPLNSTGSQGVKLIRNKAQLKDYDEAAYFPFMCEEFIVGDQVSVNLMLVNGHVQYYLLQDRFLLHDCFVDSIIMSPSKHYAKQMLEIALVDTALKACRTLGLEDGPANVQFILDRFYHPYLIEVNPRFDGPFGIECHTRSTGQNWIVDAANIALGDGTKIRSRARLSVKPNACITIASRSDGVLADDFFTVPVAVLSGIDNIVSWRWKKAGDFVTKIKAVRDCIGFVYIDGADIDKVYASALRIVKDTLVYLKEDITNE